MKKVKYLSIGQIEARTGLAVSAIRYYESEKLVHPIRNAGGQRQFQPSDIRRLSFIMIAQKMGFSLIEIREKMQTLPKNRTPNKNDWAQISMAFRVELEDRLDLMNKTIERLDKCIGCGCLSLTACGLYNQDDQARKLGAGPRYLLGDDPPNNEESKLTK